ncbi:chromosome segregation protein SMC [Hoeflea prorocentri]|uniref:Chromosome partition protein Smc n=1 Tax=Hoeflea prorocentri TaxID=1922333 RepID=A0A9X3UIU7_9HYPH|nr:chromosome segregation protein SMC [Hoeflea prorocentri]MCY6381638.1 chromosome segregation protein SMC [Hoeflea prorocentri]MDA5399438.1 chromosome segregation protein SMC [Hoeflea prorocentri]
MEFTKLRLLGFKSFVEPTEFVIERGLTGIVGPNGCGKSNLVEAMRWVMGENSYKNMRASGMDDVIFSGSGNRPARNTAEVGLFLDNHDRSAPAAFNDSDEVQVSRRIERESGSVYRINGKEARAKDVQLLFADASTGARSPSMVGQGRIGELIQAKPQARRQLLEEAAGISGLHSRRHEAELRLRAAETNLERLDDVTSELESQIESLKRQSRQANRFKMLSSEIREAEATLLHIRWTEAKTAEGEAESSLSKATSEVAELAQAQMEAAKHQAISAQKLPALRELEAKAAAALQRLQIARAQIEEEAERVAGRKAEVERRLTQLREDMEREKRMIADNAGILERLDAEEKELGEALADSGAASLGAETAFKEAGAKLEESEAALGAVTAERAEASASRSQLERSIRDADERIGRLERQLAQGEEELAGIAEKISGLPDPAEKKAAVDAAQDGVSRLETALVEIEEAIEAERRNEVTLRQPVQEARSNLNRVETEARTISEILNAGTGNDLFPPVVERMQVDRGFEAALGAALGDDLDQPDDRSAPAHWRVVGSEGDPQLPPGVIALSEHVTAPPALARRLAQVGIVANAQEGEALCGELLPGQRLVDREGALWRWDGFTAGADAPTAAAQRLAQKNRLAELDAEAVEATKALRRAEEALKAAETELKSRETLQRETRDTLREAQRSLVLAREAHADAEKAAGQFSSRRAVLTESAKQLSAQLQEAAEQKNEAGVALASAPEIGDLDKRLESLTSEVATDRGRLAEARAAFEGLRRDNEARERRLTAIGQERQSWLERASSAEGHIATLTQRLDETAAEAEKIADAPDEIDAQRRKLMNELSKAEEQRKEAADILVEAETRQREADQAAAKAIEVLSQCREQRGRAEERLNAARERRTDSEGRIRETLKCAPHEAIKQSGLQSDDALPDPEQVDRRLERLKIERERLGAVNLRAEEEQKELAERLETIVVEREDVIEAISKLRQAIQNLNREGRERLLKAFDVVNEQFRRLFTHLFGGGTAELQLIESDDPLNAGLEILARPPGKKPQTMTLLSGGEQALTAMALIFAVFLTNPAPICVLDEVDAPLDDHNVERFCNLMDEMAASTNTRFVIITHNPITMARMNRLFGVTMAEQGVSQLVSVDLETAEQMRDAS